MTDRLMVSVVRVVNPRLLGLAFILAVGLAAFAGASLVGAQRGGSGGPPAPDAYQGCVNNRTGVLRIVGAGQLCQPHETAIELGSSGGDAALLERIEALEADNASQQGLIETQQGVIDALSELTATQQTTIENQGGAITSLQAQVPDCLSTSGTEVYFTGCNVNIRSGSEATAGDVNGLGNLIIGYNESGSINGDERTGSHNLVVGPYQSYSSYGGLVVGYNNTISGPFSSVSGGAGNEATNEFSSVSGGANNTASGGAASVSAGNANTASGGAASVSGGDGNIASNNFSSVGGGFQEHADELYEFLP